jgi:hypothetical protein
MSSHSNRRVEHVLRPAERHLLKNPDAKALLFAAFDAALKGRSSMAGPWA